MRVPPHTAHVAKALSFVLGKRFAVAKLTASLSARARASTATARRFWPTYSVTRDPSQHRQRSLDSSRPGRLGSKLPLAYLTPFLIIRLIGCPFLSPFNKKVSFQSSFLQLGEPSLFGSSSAQCGTPRFLVPIGFTLFTGRPHGSKKRRSCAILR